MAWVYAFSPLSLRRFLSSFPKSMSRFAKEIEQDGGGNLGTVSSFFPAPSLGASPYTFCPSDRFQCLLESGVAKVEYQTLVVPPD